MTDKTLNPQNQSLNGGAPVAPEKALESWKEIAAYLNRDVRTVTRWEKSEHLPVHRHRHRARSSVYAYASELDAWREGRKPELESLQRSVRWRLSPAFAAFLIAAICVLSVGTGRRIRAADEKPQFRQVMISTSIPNTGGKLSPDGKKYAFVSESSLWIAPLDQSVQPARTGTPVRLTQGIRAFDRGGITISWSQDSKWIAFRAMKQGTNNPAIVYVISSSGGQPHQAAMTESLENLGFYSTALSPDGQKVYHVDGGLDQSRIYESNLGSTERRALTEPGTREPAVSPDGIWIAYLTLDPADTSTLRYPRQLWIKPLDGGDPVLAFEAPPGGFIGSPFWSPDGGKIALLVKTPGTGDLLEYTEIWTLSIGLDGRPSGPADKIALRKSTAIPIAGWTEQDEIALLFEAPHNSGLYSIPAEGGQPVQITDRWSTYPNLSADGKTIYYRADGEKPTWGLFQMATAGGSPSEIPFQGEALGIPIPGGGPSLSPDGTRLCFAGVSPSKGDKENPFPAAIYVIDVRGGRPFPVTGLTEAGSAVRAPTWSPDGKQIAFTKRGTGSGKRGINLFVVPAAGGEPRQISTGEDRVGINSDWSPDGGLIAYLGRDGTLRVISAAGGPSTILASNLGTLRTNGVAWSPDGQEIAFTARNRIWKIGRSGGEPKEVRMGLVGTAGTINWSPDGKRLVFGFVSPRSAELWLMR
jgi:Tol biopolymer transport system component